MFKDWPHFTSVDSQLKAGCGGRKCDGADFAMPMPSMPDTWPSDTICHLYLTLGQVTQ